MAKARQAELPGKQFAVNRNQYLSMIDGLMYGEDPKQGYVEDDYFYHPDLRFKFPVPRDWRTANSPQQFQMADKGGKAMMVLLAGAGTPQEALTAFNEQQQLQVVSSQNIRVNGYAAITQIADQKNEQTGAVIKIKSTVIQYGDLAYAIHGVSASADFATFQRTFEYTMNNFDQLNDPSKINRVADEIKIEEVRRAGTLAQVLRYYNMPNDRLEEISLLNSMQLEDQIPVGTWIKTVVNNGQYQRSTKTSTTPSTTPSTPNTTPSPSTPSPSTPTPTTPSTTKIPSTTKVPTTTRPSTTPQGPSTSPTRPSTTTGNGKIGTVKKKRNGNGN